MVTKKKLFCNTCKRDTNHEIKSTHDQTYYEEYEEHGQTSQGYYEKIQYCFVVCLGCDTATLEEKWTGSGMRDHNGDQIHSYNYYPKRKNLGEREIKRFHHVDKKLNETYKEIITAFQQGLGIVTAMGVRALLEGICVLEGIDDKKAWGLAKKIEKLQCVSDIPNSIIDGLRDIKFIGDDAAHRLNTPSKHTLGLSIDLLESLLIHMYEAKMDLERKAKMMKETHDKSKQLDE